MKKKIETCETCLFLKAEERLTSELGYQPEIKFFCAKNSPGRFGYPEVSLDDFCGKFVRYHDTCEGCKHYSEGCTVAIEDYLRKKNVMHIGDQKEFDRLERIGIKNERLCRRIGHCPFFKNKAVVKKIGAGRSKSGN